MSAGRQVSAWVRRVRRVRRDRRGISKSLIVRVENRYLVLSGI